MNHTKTKRAAVALTLAAAALAAAGPASADDGSSGDGIHLPHSPDEVVDGVRTGVDAAAMTWELAQAR
ncbi:MULTISPECIES: hypothetical protein [Streptomyces]|uniref:hypothetical protein n=1 Tax=Streptomyces sp. SYP-A7185 TaxID=3040076 RepID=UPI0038F6162E